MYNLKDTIVALSTAQGSGAIGVIRLSGSEAVAIANKIFAGKNLSKQKSHTVHFGKVVAPPQAAQQLTSPQTFPTETEIIDEVVMSLFLAPKSYTGEDIVEISAHGSPYILHKILGLCVQNGARLATAGEFTQRAFFNGKMDLVQAEAVADLIASENKTSHELAMNQMRGGVSSELAQLREQLINFTALIELELDFSDEDVEFADRSQLRNLIQNLKFKIQNLIESFDYGNAIKNGVPVAIIGKPNAGKSTLLNTLLNEDRAIVSDIPGTTRDAIEETVTIEGITFRFIDTAGIREHTNDNIEQIGIRKTFEKIDASSIIIYLADIKAETTAEINDFINITLDNNGQNKILLLNKADLIKGSAEYIYWHEERDKFREVMPTFLLSLNDKAKGIDNLKDVKESLLQLVINKKSLPNNVIISNIRHKEALEKSLIALQEVENGMQMNLSGDLLSLHLKDALYHIGIITGKIDVDKDVLGAIFGKFCIGK